MNSLNIIGHHLKSVNKDLAIGVYIRFLVCFAKSLEYQEKQKECNHMRFHSFCCEWRYNFWKRNIGRWFLRDCTDSSFLAPFNKKEHAVLNRSNERRRNLSSAEAPICFYASILFESNGHISIIGIHPQIAPFTIFIQTN